MGLGAELAKTTNKVKEYNKAVKFSGYTSDRYADMISSEIASRCRTLAYQGKDTLEGYFWGFSGVEDNEAIMQFFKGHIASNKVEDEVFEKLAYVDNNSGINYTKCYITDKKFAEEVYDRLLKSLQAEGFKTCVLNLYYSHLYERKLKFLRVEDVQLNTEFAIFGVKLSW